MVTISKLTAQTSGLKKLAPPEVKPIVIRLLTFPALRGSYKNMLRVLIGSMNYLRQSSLIGQNDNIVFTTLD